MLKVVNGTGLCQSTCLAWIGPWVQSTAPKKLIKTVILNEKMSVYTVMEIRSLVRKVNSNYKMFHKKSAIPALVLHHIKSRFQSRYESDFFVGSNVQNYAGGFEEATSGRG